MTYEQALKEARRVGAKNAEGLPFLAQTCAVLVVAHRGINPEMLYNGAKAKGIGALDLAKMANENVVEFAFVQFAE